MPYMTAPERRIRLQMLADCQQWDASDLRRIRYCFVTGKTKNDTLPATLVEKIRLRLEALKETDANRDVVRDALVELALYAERMKQLTKSIGVTTARGAGLTVG